MFKRLIFAMILGIVGATAHPMAAQSKPDIILFLADDLASTFIGPERRSVNVATPSIDAIGRQGIIYASGYSQPACVPSRTLLMTGKWNQRKSVGAVINNGPPPPSSVVTIAERLRGLGYATSLVGKWHLGFDSGRHPNDQGFDQFFGFKGATPDYVGHDPDAPLYRNKTKIMNTGNVTVTLTDEAVRQLTHHPAKPLFLYVAWTAPHDPLQATLAQRIAEMDAGIGRIMAAARPDTLFIFAGDNGRARGANRPFRGGKYDILEGGVRVPFAMRWDGRLAPGQRIATPVSLVDVAATAVAAAGGTLTDTDGFNLLAGVPADRSIFFKAMYNDPGFAVRRGNWKLYLNYQGIPVALYDVTKDKGEMSNVAAGNQAVVAELSDLIDGFRQLLNN